MGSQQGTDVLVRAHDDGVLMHVSGQTHGEESFTGRFLVPDDPAVAARVVRALGA